MIEPDKPAPWHPLLLGLFITAMVVLLVVWEFLEGLTHGSDDDDDGGWI